MFCPVLHIECCKVYCAQDGKVHSVDIKHLEPEDSDTLEETDLVMGNTLLWKVKGKKYTTTLLEISGEHAAIICILLYNYCLFCFRF
jgi:hypothetical protein